MKLITSVSFLIACILGAAAVAVWWQGYAQHGLWVKFATLYVAMWWVNITIVLSSNWLKARAVQSMVAKMAPLGDAFENLKGSQDNSDDEDIDYENIGKSVKGSLPKGVKFRIIDPESGSTKYKSDESADDDDHPFQH